MKFVHTADLHLGATDKRLPAEKKKICKEEQMTLCAQLFDFARKENAEFVLVAGDLFHSAAVPTKLVNYFFAKVKEFEKPVIYVRGNHDEEFELKDLPQNFKVLSSLQSIDFGDVKVWGQSGTQNLILPKLEENKKNIVLLHGDIYSGGEDYIDLKALKGKNIDYLALGHLHAFQVADFERGKLCYSGSLFGSGFDECGEKGAVLVEIDDKISVKFVPFAPRQYRIVELDITGLYKLKEFQEKICETLAPISKKDLVRLILTGYFEESAEKYLSILQESPEQFYFEIVDKSKLKIDLEKYKGEELSFKAELLNLIDASDLTMEEKNKIAQLSIEALRGDDLSL